MERMRTSLRYEIWIRNHMRSEFEKLFIGQPWHENLKSFRYCNQLLYMNYQYILKSGLNGKDENITERLDLTHIYSEVEKFIMGRLVIVTKKHHNILLKTVRIISQMLPVFLNIRTLGKGLQNHDKMRFEGRSK